ncbi:MAG TPA: PAS domain-containing protein, partial [Nocardioides sp.]|nr:PAS domain-containing protein [Nocardioides sp.]
MELPTGFDAQDLGEVLDALPSLVAYVDATGVLRYANAAARTWLDLSPAEVVGRPVEELLDEAGCETTRERLTAALGGHAQRFERALPGRGGRARHALIELVPRSRDGRSD